ncbi:MAG: hypothetical protein AB7P14_17990 [Blastocatellales bacterium]
MNSVEMNARAQETACEMKHRFPEMTDEQIKKVTRFIVLSAYAVKASEAFLAEQFGPDTGLSEKGYELIFKECAEETLLIES